ncbi:MAG: LEA type 2 family protein [Flavobacteriales bacterium]|nr:LEA type 2 family protein [Flavobacteriales bacterium]
MNLRVLSTLILFLTLTLSSCKIYQDVDVIEVENVVFREFDIEGAEAEVWLRIKNPNSYKVVLTESNIDLYLEGKHMGQVQLLENMVVPKKSLSTQVMKVEVTYDNMEDLLGNVLMFLFKENFVLEAKGHVKGKALFVAKKVDVNFKEVLTREELGL